MMSSISRRKKPRSMEQGFIPQHLPEFQDLAESSVEYVRPAIALSRFWGRI